jgi:transcription elongation factor Elf1
MTMTPETITPRKTYICSRCGSSDVSQDANAMWDSARQEWVLRGIYDNATCEQCGKETELKEVEL